MSRRLYRVNEAVREVVSQAIETEVKDPRLGFVTVTGVETTPDLRQARVFVSVLGDETRRAETLEALRAAHGMLQRAVADHVRLKRTPRLEFLYDSTTDNALHINELLAAEEAQISELTGDRADDDEAGDEQSEGPVEGAG
jgi:ribosome-binding factor A